MEGGGRASPRSLEAARQAGPPRLCRRLVRDAGRSSPPPPKPPRRRSRSSRRAPFGGNRPFARDNFSHVPPKERRKNARTRATASIACFAPVASTPASLLRRPLKTGKRLRSTTRHKYIYIYICNARDDPFSFLHTLFLLRRRQMRRMRER